MKQCYLLIFMYVITGSCFAQSTPIDDNAIDRKLEDCLAALTDEDTGGMIDCHYAARMAWDKQVNNYYNLLVETLKPTELKKFKDAQRKWIEYRDAEMAFSTSIYKNMEGNLWLLVHAGRLTDIFKQRALDLESYYEAVTLD
jgi:uncharacterized protein YecT (DUF1311 family)